MRTATRSTKIRVLVVLALGVIAALVITAATSGFSDPAVPDGDVAFVDGVDDGGVTQKEFDAAMKEAATALGLPKVPPEDDESYPQLVTQAMQGLLLPIWVNAEADERGIDVTEEDVQTEFDSQKEQAGIKSDEQLAKVLKERDLTEEEVVDGIRDQLVQDALLADAAPGPETLPEDVAALPQEEQVDKLAEEYDITDDDIEDYYDTAVDKPVAEGGFLSPPTRTARVILNTSQKKIDQAKAELEKGDLSDQAWKKAAEKYSQDQTSSANGGELPAPVEEGSATPSPYEEEVFDAPLDELVGPIDTGERGFLLLQVTKETPEEVQPLDDALELQIKSLIVNERAQEEFSAFQEDFLSKWTDRTYCEPVAESEFCHGYEPPAEEPVPGEPAPPPVIAPSPIAPGTAEIPLSSATQGAVPAETALPQAPGAGVQVPDPAADLPPGATTIPGGAVPPTGATGAPPTGTTGAPPPTGG